MAEESDEDADWVEIRRVTDAVQATMIRDFLHDHDVRTAVRGNAGVTAPMPWSPLLLDIRIVVAPSQVEAAREILKAMEAGAAVDQPFRGAGPSGDDTEEKYVHKRSALAAAMLGLLVPIGAGHFYARHGAAGTILCAGIVGSFLTVMAGARAEMMLPGFLLIAVDVVGSRWAVKRWNDGRVPPEPVQRSWALGALLIAFAIGWISLPTLCGP